MLGFLLNIGHDIGGILIEMIAYVNKIRASSRVLKIVLWPISYGLTFVKVITLVCANGAKQFYNHSFPEGVLATRNHIYSATPVSIYCFNKRMFFIFLLEIYFFCFFCFYLYGSPVSIFPYLLVKVVVSAVPFLALSPTQRLPFWFLATALTFLEICIGLFLILSIGFGIDFAQGHFYMHWKKHYRYRAPTSNRRIFFEIVTHTYVLIKLFMLNDVWCSWQGRWEIPLRDPVPARAKLIDDRLKNPHTPTKGGFAVLESLSLSPSVLCSFGLLVLGLLAYQYSPAFRQALSGSVYARRVLFFSQLLYLRKNMIKSELNKIKMQLKQQFVQLNSALSTPIVVPPYPFLMFISTAICLAIEVAAFRAGLIKPVPAGSIFLSVPNCFGSISPDFEFINALVEQDTVSNLRYGILFLLALSSLGVYSIILAGWSSNSKYAFIGALRSAAQMISYEVAISLIILPVVVFSGSLNLSMITYVQHITTWLIWPLLPVALLFLVAMLAETNRTPFDLPEAEAELVAGYNVDYSSLPFAMFFLGEYCNMILISTLYCLLFLSGGLNGLGVSSALVLSAKAAIIWVFFVLVRATLPRYRYDQLMDIGWKVFLPVSGSFLLFVFGVLVFFSALPVANELPLNHRGPVIS